jgi:sarcosine oxidase subunit beta
VAAAYELAGAGASVTLVEQGTLANMASGWTLAGVRQSGRDPAELPLAMVAVARWGTLGEELGADLEYRRGGNLRLAMTEAQVEPTREMVAEQQRLGLALDFLPDNRAVREVAPAIAGSVLAASYCPTDGHANPNRTVGAYGRAAERLGARLLTGTTVTGIDADNGRVRGVRTSAGDIAADVVVVTAGVFSGRLVAPLGIDLPIDVARVAVVQTTPRPPLLQQVLGTGAADFAGRQEVGGRFRFTDGGTPWPHSLDALADGFETVLPTTRTVASALASATAALPALADARVAHVWGGLLDMTPDALPIIERAPDVEGLVIAAGFSGHGFCLGPVTGQIIRDLVVEGETPFPIAAFRGDRFGGAARRASATLHG